MFLNLIEQKDLTKRGNSLYNSILTKTMHQALVQDAVVIKRDNLKVSDEELNTLSDNWSNAVDIEGFSQYLTREKEATSFIKAVVQYASKNPDDVNVLQDAKDLTWGGLEGTKAYSMLNVFDRERISKTNSDYSKSIKGRSCIE